MEFKIFKKIDDLESLIFKGYKLWIFRGYVAVNKRGVEKIIDDIYATLPVDVQRARQYLKEHDFNNETIENKSSIYSVLKDLEIFLNKNSFFDPFIIINKKKFEQFKDKLKQSVPKDIYEAEQLDN